MTRNTLLLAAALVGLIAASARADMVVLEARGVAFKQGQKVEETRKITLSEGQRLTLIASNGRTVKLTGPYDDLALPEAKDQTALARASEAFEALKVQKVARLTEIGTVRGTNVEVPEAWLLDPDHDGNICMKEGGDLKFYRSSTARQVSFYFAPSDRSWSVRLPWTAGADQITVPKDQIRIRLRDKQTFIVGTDNTQHSVTLNLVPAAAAEPAVQAAWLEEKECIPQAKAAWKAVNGR